VEFILNRVDEIIRYGEFVQFYLPFSPDVLKSEVLTEPYLRTKRLQELRDFLLHILELKKKFSKSPIINYFNFKGDFSDILKEINRVIDENGIIRDNASGRLKKIRMRKHNLRNNIIQTLNLILKRQANNFSSLIISQRNGRYVLPLKVNFKKDMPGIVHAFSNSGETVFVEPMEILDDSAEMVKLDSLEQEEVAHILRELTYLIKNKIDDIEANIAHIVDLDILFARARWALEFKATRPVLGDYLDIKNGYHPIIKRIKEQVIPLNLKIDSDHRILLISGPNAGGKTVVLKTVGLICLLARCGFFIPADEGTTIPFFDEIYADIGDEQSIESNISTFAGHLIQIKDALGGKENSLVLLDELMSQTSAEEGSALAASILEEFVYRGNIVLATTHNENLKIFVSRHKNMVNGGMEWTDRPTYRLIIGVPQPSNAIKLAGQFGFGSDILTRAISYLDQDKLSIGELFESLSRELKTVQEQHQKLQTLKQEYEARLKDFKSKKKKELDELKSQYKEKIVQAKRSIERLIKTLKLEGPKPEIVRETRKFFKKPDLLIEEDKSPYYPDLGEIVSIRELKTSGEVVASRKGKYKINLNNIIYWANPEELEPASNKR